MVESGRGQLRGILNVAGGELSGGELQAGRVDSGALTEKMQVECALRKSGVAGAVGANRVVRVGLNQRSAERILHGGLRH